MKGLVLFTDVFAAILFIVGALPLLKREIEPNRWYGIRIRKAFASEENWYRINQYGARRLIFWSVAVLLGAAAGLFLPLSADGFLFWLYLGLPVLVALVSCLEVLVYASRL